MLNYTKISLLFQLNTLKSLLDTIQTPKTINRLIDSNVFLFYYIKKIIYLGANL